MPHDPSFDSHVLEIADDDNYDVEGDAYDNSSTKIEPSVGVITQGLMRPGRQIPAQHLNWVLSEFAAILVALIANDVSHETRLDTDEAELADHETRITTAEDWIADNSPRLRIMEFLVNSTFVVPARCTFGMSYGCGGGGGGGRGNEIGGLIDCYLAGGAGGGGATASFQVFPLVPGRTVTVTIGAGGLGGHTSLGDDGADGATTYISDISGTLAAHLGGRGGEGSAGVVGTNWYHYTLGGGPVSGTSGVIVVGPQTGRKGIRFDTSSTAFFRDSTLGQTLYVVPPPGSGGYGAGGSKLPGSDPSLSGVRVGGSGLRQPGGGFAGGLGGYNGKNGDTNTPPGDTTKKGGGAGGGGGAGPFGPGAEGGSGAFGQAVLVPTGGFDAAANTGAGGGGCGSAGCDNSNLSGRGGNGGSGRVYVILVLESLATITRSP